MSEKDYKSIVNLSWQLRREKRFEEAELLLLEALAEHDEGGFEHSVLKVNLADVLLRRGDPGAARRAALEVLERSPEETNALTVVGMAALETGTPLEAADNLGRAYRLAPNPFRAGRLARALELGGREREAVALLREALEKNPRDEFLLKQYSAMERRAGGNDREAEALPAALKDAGEEDFLAYAEKVKLKLAGLEPAGAAASLEKLVRVGRRRENPHLHLLLGDLLKEAGREEEAAQSYRKARELNPENLSALVKLLYSYRRLGRKEEAWPLLKLLLYHRPADRTAKASLIKDAGELGRERETVLFFEELLRKHPHRRELYGAIRKLQAAAENGQGGNK